MPKTQLNKSQRRALASVCYFAFHQLMNVAVGVRWDEWFREALTEEDKKRLVELKKATNTLANHWRDFAWKLEGRR